MREMEVAGNGAEELMDRTVGFFSGNLVRWSSS